jgi:hypothetical protein
VRAAAGFAQPYDLDVERTDKARDGLWAALRHSTPAGWFVRLEFQSTDGALLQVEIACDRHEELDPQIGERLYLRLRRVRVFLAVLWPVDQGIHGHPRNLLCTKTPVAA